MSRQQTDSNRTAIMQASARLLRERGLRGISVADLMAAAGLTHGGFYGHFASKDALVAAACGSAYAGSLARWRSRVAGSVSPAAARAAIVEGYLSPGSQSSPGTSCPVAAWAADVAREPAAAPVREAFLDGLQELLEVLASLQETGEAGADRREAQADLATMVGALLLARATAGHAVAEEFLAAGRARLVGTDREAPSAQKPKRTVR